MTRTGFSGGRIPAPRICASATESGEKHETERRVVTAGHRVSGHFRGNLSAVSRNLSLMFYIDEQTTGLCRLLRAPAGSWPFPTLSLQILQ